MSQNLQELSIKKSSKAQISIITCTENIFNGIKSCALEVLQQQVKIGLCINCEKSDYCSWQENKKIYCEHYQ